MYMHCSFPGIDCSLQSYQILVQFPVIWSLIILLGGLAIESYRLDTGAMPTWLAAISALAMVSITPIGLGLQLALHLLVWQSAAPLSLSAVVTGFGLYALWMFSYFLVGLANWAKLTRC